VHRERHFRVAIYDTDASGLIFFGAPTRWWADAEVEFLAALDIPFPLMDPMSSSSTQGLSCPVRAYEVSIDRPLRYHEPVQHRTWIGEVGRTSCVFVHEVSSCGSVCVRGRTTRVFVDVAGDGSMVPVAVPDAIRAAVNRRT
jgi:acyl-CoA thioesterase FadM